MNVTSDNCMAAKNMELPNSKKGNRRGITRNTTMKILVINGSPKGRGRHEAAAVGERSAPTRFMAKTAVAEAPMFNVPEAAEVTVPFLELVREAGRHYAESYSVPDELMEKLAIPMIPEEMYTAIANGEMI